MNCYTVLSEAVQSLLKNNAVFSYEVEHVYNLPPRNSTAVSMPYRDSVHTPQTASCKNAQRYVSEKTEHLSVFQ